MSQFDAVFAEILLQMKDFNKRIRQFETWEPAAGFVDTGAHAYLSSDQAVNFGAWRQILFDVELWDTDSIHDSSTFTIPEDGKYLFNTVITISGTVVGSFFCRIYKSATEIIQKGSIGTVSAVQASGVMDCVAGDTIIVEASTSVNTTVSGSATDGYTTFFQVQRVG